jgi:uncharacterized protein
MNKEELVLAALAPGKGALHKPVQVQKLLFLIDREIANILGGPFFDFKPYDYGPFDKDVYAVLEALADQGYVDIVPENTWRSYKLTSMGQAFADVLLKRCPERAVDYIQRSSAFVRELSFTQLVGAIYKAYPEMRANSIFRG